MVALVEYGKEDNTTLYASGTKIGENLIVGYTCAMAHVHMCDGTCTKMTPKKILEDRGNITNIFASISGLCKVGEK